MDKDKPASKKTVKKQAKPTALAKVDGISSLEMLPKIQAFAEYIKNSTSWGKAFADKDGEINTEDIVANVILGHEMGIEPMAAIMQGKELNKDSYFAVLKGKSLGLDPITAMQNIHNISTSGGKKLITGIHIISKAILDSGATFEILEDYVPVYRYTNIANKVVINSEFILDNNNFIKEPYQLYQPHYTVDYLKERAAQGTLFITRTEITKRTTIQFTRIMPSKTISFPILMTLQDAIDAGLYPGNHSKFVDAKGKPIISKGKSNWENYPATMLRNRVLATGGRIIAADKLQGIYETSEVLDLTDQTYTIDEDGNAIPDKNDNA